MHAIALVLAGSSALALASRSPLLASSASRIAGPHPNGIDGLPYSLTGSVSPVHDPAIAYDPVSKKARRG